jgi:hypothetical protein
MLSLLAESASSAFPTWYVVVSIAGLVVAAGGVTAITFVIKSFMRGYRTLHAMEPLIPGLTQVVQAFVGSDGAGGSRIVEPLLSQLDTNSKQGEKNSEDIFTLQRGIDEIRRQVSPNGGNTDSFADQFVSWRSEVNNQIETLVGNQARIEDIVLQTQQDAEPHDPQQVNVTVQPAGVQAKA